MSEDEMEITGLKSLKEAAEKSGAKNGLPTVEWSVFEYEKKESLAAYDRENNLARVSGPLRVPLYREAYLLAAEKLADVAETQDLRDELAVPVLYLLRHAAELALKDLLDARFELERSRARGKGDFELYPSEKDREKVYGHNLTSLRDHLENRLEEELPTRFREAVIALEQVSLEEKAGQRFRYATFTKQERDREAQEVPWGQAFRHLEKSSVKKPTIGEEDEIKVCLSEWADGLRSGFDEVFAYSFEELQEGEKLYAEMALEAHNIEQTMLQREHMEEEHRENVVGRVEEAIAWLEDEAEEGDEMSSRARSAFSRLLKDCRPHLNEK